MIFSQTDVIGAWVIDLERREDPRGFFARSWCVREFESHGLETHIEQINVGFSGKKGTLRGMHYQVAPDAEVKVVRCTRGAVYDVVLDLRPDSPSYRRWAAFELTAAQGRMLYVPEGCAHGYQTLEDASEICYLTSRAYAPGSARGVRFDDAAFDIRWPLAVTNLSEGDRSWPDYGENPS